MNKNKLEIANKLDKRIRDLKILKIYLSEKSEFWWNDFIRLFFPKVLFEKLKKKDYDYLETKQYDEEFCEDVLNILDTLIEKYTRKLENL